CAGQPCEALQASCSDPSVFHLSGYGQAFRKERARRRMLFLVQSQIAQATEGGSQSAATAQLPEDPRSLFEGRTGGRIVSLTPKPFAQVAKHESHAQLIPQGSKDGERLLIKQTCR